MADAPKAGGLENIVGAATAIGGGVLGNSLASYLGLGALGSAALTATGLAAGGLLAAPLLCPVIPGKSILNQPVDPLYGFLGGSTAAIVTGLAAYAALGPLGLLYAIPAYFLGKGVVGGYGKALVDNIASGFKGIATYGAKFEKGVRDIGNGIAGWYQNFPNGFRNLGENLYTRGANAWNYIRNLGRQAPVAAPAPAAGH
ncbi:TPA: hypothetical protein HA281_02410 [Candidatus Woesearchaeota archaeon]|nr:MAG: hypothetical protein QT04_C0046G0008 [archaeon GW2011_AR11]HIH04861.1 hypothetical protein [Candidatus Woesearchaeota archaeon]HIH91630.1 hypothetical protein [Candidatus Woesearchaeota archaeon]HII64557.1 hypothetical protein [Candidatus Woesearchaeota archaeon]